MSPAIAFIVRVHDGELAGSVSRHTWPCLGGGPGAPYALYTAFINCGLHGQGVLGDFPAKIPIQVPPPFTYPTIRC